jgi:hypothetical protein
MSENETFIIHPKDPSAIVRLQDPTVIEQLLEQPMTVIAEVLAGFFSSGNGYWAAAGCKLAQAAFKGKGFQQFALEFKQLRAKGAIPEDYAEKKYGAKTWVELVTILDEESPDEDRAEALKAMFFAVNKVNSTDAERILNYQLFQISKELSSGELLLLKAISQFCTMYPGGNGPANSNFVREVSKLLGHNVTALIRKDIRKLLTTSLVASGSVLSDAHGPTDPTGASITDLGHQFIENLKSYSAALNKPA